MFSLNSSDILVLMADKGQSQFSCIAETYIQV